MNAAVRRLLRALFFAFRRYRPARVSEGLTPAERQALLGTPPFAASAERQDSSSAQSA